MIVAGNGGEGAESVNDTKETKQSTQRSHWNPRSQFNYSLFLPGPINRILSQQIATVFNSNENQLDYTIKSKATEWFFSSSMKNFKIIRNLKDSETIFFLLPLNFFAILRNKSNFSPDFPLPHFLFVKDPFRNILLDFWMLIEEFLDVLWNSRWLANEPVNSILILRLSRLASQSKFCF